MDIRIRLYELVTRVRVARGWVIVGEVLVVVGRLNFSDDYLLGSYRCNNENWEMMEVGNTST